MSMADGKIKIDTEIDSKGISKGLNEIAGKIKKFANTNIGLSTLKDTAGLLKGIYDDLTESYRVQAQAETQLEAAAKNNPYLLSESVTKLKNYASEIQSISTYGDEQLIPFMAQLASAGRTEAEIMEIMSASVDLAASGSMSLDSAVKNLNKTYSGLSGELGETNPQIKALTAEQLKSGQAVKIIASQYKGMASEVAKATGTSQQLKNAMGDLKEELGAPFEKAVSPVRAFFAELIGGWASAKKAKRELEESLGKIEEGTAGTDDYSKALAEANKELERLLQNQRDLNEALSDPAGETATAILENIPGVMKGDVDALKLLIEMTDEAIKKQEEEIKTLEAARKPLADAEQAAAQEAETEKKRAEALAAENEQMEKRDKLREAYDETLRQKQVEINQRRINGEEISEEAEAQEMYNTAFAAYIKMMSDPAFAGNSGNYKHETDAREQIAHWAETGGKSELEKQIKEFEAELSNAADEASGIVKSQYDAIIRQLDDEYEAVINNKYIEEEEKLRIEKEFLEKRRQIADAKDKEEKDALLEKIADKTGANETYWSAYKSKIKELKTLEDEVNENTVLSTEEKEAQKTKITEAAVQARKELIASIASDVQKYTSQAVSIMQDACNLMLETSKNEATAEQAELEIKYRKGEMSEEEYNEKISESKKKAAREQYKIQMWQWSASILQATANIAQGVSMAIAQAGFPAGLITGALVGAAGAVQIASIIASKPTPPNFSTGGIVGGSSTHGDNIAANLNSREMVMNMSQQKGLWDFINGGSRGAQGGANIVINNSAANIVSARPQITKDKIELIIDARVNESLRSGRYSKSLGIAQDGMQGEFYGI